MSAWLLRKSKTLRLTAWVGIIFLVLISGFRTGVKLEKGTR